MLSEDQQDQLLLSLFATAEVMGQQLTQGAALLMVEDLREYSEDVLSNALRTCRLRPRAGGWRQGRRSYGLHECLRAFGDRRQG